jgi:undecaprenyl-diphosphatase
MTWWHAALLGLLQGLTEFLPVSSSGHLALAQMLVPGFEQPGVVFDATLHVGTTLAVIWFERREIVRWATSREGWRLGWLLVLGTLATAVVAFPLEHLAESAFSSLTWVGVGLVVTAIVVAATRWVGGGTRDETTTGWRQVVAVGLVQGMAVFPGVSRSGSTILTGLASGLERSWAARFSFLLSVPAVLGATLVQVVGEREAIAAAGPAFWLACVVGAVVAAVSGVVALHLVLRTLSSEVFHRFAWYCLPLGVVVLVLAWWGR